MITSCQWWAAGGANAFPNVEERCRVAVGVTRGCKSLWAGKGDDEKEPGLISLAEEKFWFIIILPDDQKTTGGYATEQGSVGHKVWHVLLLLIFFFVYVCIVWVCYFTSNSIIISFYDVCTRYRYESDNFFQDIT